MEEGDGLNLTKWGHPELEHNLHVLLLSPPHQGGNSLRSWTGSNTWVGAVAPRSAYLWCFGFRDTVRVPAAVAGLPAGYCSATGRNGVSFGSVPATPQVNLVGSFLDLPTYVGRLPPEMGKPTSMQGRGRIIELQDY